MNLPLILSTLTTVIETEQQVNTQVISSPVTGFFGTPIPYVLIGCIFVAAVVFLVLGFRIDKMRMVSLLMIPTLLLLGTASEIALYLIVGDNALWWCDPERYSFGECLLRVLPLVLIIALQLCSFYFYKLLVSDNSSEDLSWKPTLVGIVVSVPIVAIGANVLHYAADMTWESAITWSCIASLIFLGICLLITIRRNVSILGVIGGVSFSIFTLIYMGNAVVAVAVLVALIIKLFSQVILISAGIVIFGLMSRTGLLSGGGGGGKNPGAGSWKYKDRDGVMHHGTEGRDAANERISKRTKEM